MGVVCKCIFPMVVLYHIEAAGSIESGDVTEKLTFLQLML